ncbi:hypothetical protein CFC21_107493 [Triticum aestivum]|uniref:Uncharacterized protein n=2 Tax=Triticum aestivum TaxID=4565 RepID=A0A3B6TJS9_WHEAT|nr:hypothetical protein CFC21_107493 [Triticum aestivum]
MSTDDRWCYIVLGVAASRRAGPWTGTSSRSGWWSFVRTALEQTRLRTALTPHPSQKMILSCVMLPGKVQAHTSQRRCDCFGCSLLQRS